MKKFLFTCVLSVSVLPAMAFDASNCEIIGHQVGHATPEHNCLMKADCDPNEHSPEICDKAMETMDECLAHVEQMNIAAQDTKLYRCPATPELVAQKDMDKDMGQSDKNFIMNDDSPVVFDDLISDKENVYFIYKPAGANGTVQSFFERGETWRIVGNRNEDGLFLGVVK